WILAGAGDLHGDGRTDLVWQHASTGDVRVWPLDGGPVSGPVLLDGEPAPWRMAGVGDLDGDGHADLVWRDPSTGRNRVWLMRRTTRLGVGEIRAAHAP